MKTKLFHFLIRQHPKIWSCVHFVKKCHHGSSLLKIFTFKWNLTHSHWRSTICNWTCRSWGCCCRSGGCDSSCGGGRRRCSRRGSSGWCRRWRTCNFGKCGTVFTWSLSRRWSYKQNLSVNLCYAHFRPLLLVEILEQPTRMLNNERSVILR